MAGVNGSFALAALISATAALRHFPHRPAMAAAALAVPVAWLLLGLAVQRALLDRAATGRIAESDRFLERLRTPARAAAFCLTALASLLLVRSI